MAVMISSLDMIFLTMKKPPPKGGFGSGFEVDETPASIRLSSDRNSVSMVPWLVPAARRLALIQQFLTG
jgi:hypothetical protein